MHAWIILLLWKILLWIFPYNLLYEYMFSFLLPIYLGIAGSHGKIMLNSLRNCQIVGQNSFNIFYSYQQHMSKSCSTFLLTLDNVNIFNFRCSGVLCLVICYCCLNLHFSICFFVHSYIYFVTYHLKYIPIMWM